MSHDPDGELRKIQRLSEILEIVLPERSLAVAYGETEAILRRKGKAIPTMDLLIGMTAKLHGLPLLTADDEHFRRIPGLKVETY